MLGKNTRKTVHLFHIKFKHQYRFTEVNIQKRKNEKSLSIESNEI